ncbi:Translation initiation factor IF-3, mitochondrial [Branchiostoma belcheri]|nr:Translation initiation factor IF-3, mitochondrial [Branchiostoma belcheri]
MAAPMCRHKLMAFICTRTFQVQHRSLPDPWTLKPVQFFSTSSACPRLLSSNNETTLLQSTNMFWWRRRNVTTLKFDFLKTSAIGCHSFSSSALTNDSVGKTSAIGCHSFSSSSLTNDSDGKTFPIGCYRFSSFISTNDSDGKTSAIDCHSFSSSASTNDSDHSSTRPQSEVKLPSNVKIKTLDAVGQRIRPGTIHLFEQEGKSMGAVHSVQALKLTNDPENSGIRLVLIDAEAKPYPAYQLMTPQQLLDERAKLREEKKANKGVGAVHTMKFSSDITKHDLSHKVHKIDSFIDKKSLVKISISNPRNSKKTTEDMVKLADNILKLLTNKAVYQTPPILKGTAVNCVIRPASDKDTGTGKKK